MRGRTVIGAAVIAALVGGGAGAAAAYVERPDTTDAGVASPVPATAPSVPSLPTPQPTVVNTDIDYPALVAPTSFTRLRVGNSLATWSIVKPRGWQAYCISKHLEQVAIPDARAAACADSGIYFRPTDEPLSGGYSFRVRALTDHLPAADERVDKIRAITGSTDYRDVKVLPQSAGDRVYFTLLTPQGDSGTYLRRSNYFQWFTAPGDSYSTLEMSVNGRSSDDAGLQALFDSFAAKVRPVG